MPIGCVCASQRWAPRPSFHQLDRDHKPFLTTSTSTRSAIWSSASSTRSSIFAASPHATRRPRFRSQQCYSWSAPRSGYGECQQDLGLATRPPEQDRTQRVLRTASEPCSPEPSRMPDRITFKPPYPSRWRLLFFPTPPDDAAWWPTFGVRSQDSGTPKQAQTTRRGYGSLAQPGPVALPG